MPLLVAVGLVFGSAQALAQRVALLIGNANYQVGRLTNPPNDVREMKAALEAVGFTVQPVVVDGDQKAMKRALRDFGAAAQGAEIAFLYYSGHGVQANGENYLIPVQATIEKESDYEVEAVSANAVIAQINGARPKAAIVVLDACRDNPLAAQTRSASKGLSRMSAPTGSMIAFATAPNSTASDNGVYARTLAAQIRRPGAELIDVFRDTAMEVLRLTNGKQDPRVSEFSINQRVYLAGPATNSTVSKPPPQVVTSAAEPPRGGAGLVVQIGHVAPLSGPLSRVAKDGENGARMAIEDLNAQGMTIGSRQVRFELVAQDDAGDPKQAAAVAQKLCDMKVSGVVGHVNSSTTIAASRVYNACGIPHITPSATNPRLTQAGFKTTFRLIGSDNAVSVALANYAADRLKLKRIAVMDDRTAYGQGAVDAFKKAAVQRGLEIVNEQYSNDKSTDFTAMLTAIKSSRPEAIFYGGMDSQAGPMLRQLDGLGMSNVRLLGGDGICTEGLARLADGAKALGGVVCVGNFVMTDRTPALAAWRARYDQKFPGEAQVNSPYTYDATMVLANAMKEAGSVDPKAYLPFLASTSYQGVVGKVQFAPDGELKNPPMTYFAYRGGKLTAIGSGN